MVGNSLEKKYTHPGRIPSNRKNPAGSTGNTTKYIRQSAEFTTLMSDLAIEGIGAYVKTMEEQVCALRQMTRNGTIDPRIVSSLVETIGITSEMTTTNLNHIRNSLVRFMHTDTASMINQEVVRNQDPCGNKSPVSDLSQTPVTGEIFSNPVAECDIHGS